VPEDPRRVRFPFHNDDQTDKIDSSAVHELQQIARGVYKAWVGTSENVFVYKRIELLGYLPHDTCFREKYITFS